jgi:hypothetical protein
VVDLDVDGRIIFTCILEKWDLGVDWRYLVQDSDQWWDPVNTVMNLRIPKIFGIFLSG